MNKNTELIVPLSYDMVPNAGPKRGLSEILISSYEENKMRDFFTIL